MRRADEQTRALLNLLVETIEADRCPFSPRVGVFCEIRAKFGERGRQTRGLVADSRSTAIRDRASLASPMTGEPRWGKKIADPQAGRPSQGGTIRTLAKGDGSAGRAAPLLGPWKNPGLLQALEVSVQELP